jgi:hypothetical protein
LIYKYYFYFLFVLNLEFCGNIAVDTSAAHEMSIQLSGINADSIEKHNKKKIKHWWCQVTVSNCCLTHSTWAVLQFLYFSKNRFIHTCIWLCTHSGSVHTCYNVNYKFDKYNWSSYNFRNDTSAAHEMSIQLSGINADSIEKHLIQNDQIDLLCCKFAKYLLILCLQIPLVFIDTLFANPFSIYWYSVCKSL